MAMISLFEAGRKTNTSFALSLFENNTYSKANKN